MGMTVTRKDTDTFLTLSIPCHTFLHDHEEPTYCLAVPVSNGFKEKDGWAPNV